MMQNLNLNPGSLLKLEECDKKLQLLFKTVAKTEKYLVLCGYRNQVDQDKAFSTGHSKLKWPHGKHNTYPSKAIDIAPIPLDFSDSDAFYRLGGTVMKTAQQLGIKIRWGAQFEKLKDLGHYELMDEEDSGDKPITEAVEPTA